MNENSHNVHEQFEGMGNMVLVSLSELLQDHLGIENQIETEEADVDKVILEGAQEIESKEEGEHGSNEHIEHD